MSTADDIIKLIRNDAFAITFQTMGQYRAALVNQIDKMSKSRLPTKCFGCNKPLLEGDVHVDVDKEGHDWAYWKCTHCGKEDETYLLL